MHVARTRGPHVWNHACICTASPPPSTHALGVWSTVLKQSLTMHAILLLSVRGGEHSPSFIPPPVGQQQRRAAKHTVQHLCGNQLQLLPNVRGGAARSRRPVVSQPPQGELAMWCLRIGPYLCWCVPHTRARARAHTHTHTHPHTPTHTHTHTHVHTHTHTHSLAHICTQPIAAGATTGNKKASRLLLVYRA